MRIASLILAALLQFHAFALAAGDAQRPRVSVTGGTLEGLAPQDAPGAVFKGVPFAQAPVGTLRWRPPAAVQAWAGVKDAATFGAACAQAGRGGPGSEDCLYLNVWTPAWPLRAAYPVMVWIHGGANMVGSAANPTFDGAAFAKRGIVLVTVNHRLGVMGFMAHPALSAESVHKSSGNYALLDQIMALRWVQENIASFGGDPRRVTLFGQSSGSYDILSLMTSPLAKGLFVNAIAQSGQILSYGGAMPKARAEEIGTRIAAALRAPADAAALRYLRELPADQVIAGAAQLLPTDLGSDTGLLTSVDGWVLPEAPARAFAAGRQMAIPLIVGNNSREISQPVAADELRRQISAKYGELAPQALQAYGLANGAQGSDDPLLGGPAAQWMTDTVQRCAAVMEAGWHAAARNRTWQYQFERSIPGREAVGSFHGAEIAFVFGTLGRATATPFTAGDRGASEQLQEYWTNFAKRGDPNGGSLPAWPAAGNGRYLAFTATGPLASENLQPGPCRVFRDWALRLVQ